MFKNKKPSAIIFDLDGTLVDSALDLSATLNHLLKIHDRPEVPLSKVRQMVGQGAKALIIKGFSETGHTPDDKKLSILFNEFIEYYKENISAKTIVFPSVIKTLEELKDLNIKMAVCTNKPLELSNKLLQNLGLADYFSAVTGGDSFKYLKPDPRHILSTLDILDADPQYAIMIGDSSNDIIAAKAANIASIAVTFGYTDRHVSEFHPNQIIDHYEEFITAMQLISDRF
jgi:phosphoglycolate phosphatase